MDIPVFKQVKVFLWCRDMALVQDHFLYSNGPDILVNDTCVYQIRNHSLPYYLYYTFRYHLDILKRLKLENIPFERYIIYSDRNVPICENSCFP